MAIVDWVLGNPSGSGDTVLRRLSIDGATLTWLTSDITCPFRSYVEVFTGLRNVTAIIKTHPGDADVAYIGVCTDGGYNARVYKYNSVGDVFTELLHLPATGGEKFVVADLWISPTDANDVYILIGNPTLSDFGPATESADQGVWYSTGDATATYLGSGHNGAFTGANINHPSSCTRLVRREGISPILYVSHEPCYATTDAHVHNLSWSSDGATWFASANAGQNQFAFNCFAWLQMCPPGDVGNIFYSADMSGTGAYSFSESTGGNFYNAGADTWSGYQQHGQSGGMLLPFDTDTQVQLSFSTNTGVVQRSTNGGLTFNTATIPNFLAGIFGPNSARTQPGGLHAIAITYSDTGPAKIIWTNDKGAAFFEFDWDGMGGVAVAIQEAGEMAVYKTVMGYRDVKGKLSYVTYYTTAISLAAARIVSDSAAAAFAAISNANQETLYGASTVQVVAIQYGANAVFKNIEDQAELVFSDERGNFHRYRVPAPKQDIFYADGITVDPTAGGIVALVAALTSTGVSGRGGQQLITFIGGRRTRGKSSRRLSAILRSPLLVGPA